MSKTEVREGKREDRGGFVEQDFSPEDYGPPDIYAEGDNPIERREKLIKEVPGARKEREQMFENIGLLDNELKQLPKGTEKINEVLKTIVKKVAVIAAETLPAGEEKERTLTFLQELEEPGRLYQHLTETRKAASEVSKGLAGKLEGPGGLLLTPRQLTLIEFSGDIHDLGKLMGSMKAQIDPDHEVVFSKIIGKYLEGMKYTPLDKTDEEAITLTADDVKFVVGLCSYHEDIWREKAFANQVDSFDKNINPEDDVKTAIERARMIFHFIDIFGAAVGFDDKGKMGIKDMTAFENRFVDLFRRHIRLPIKGLEGKKTDDWTRAKVFRPEWGLHGIAGLTWTFEALQHGWEVNVDPGFLEAAQDGILRVLDEAYAAGQVVLDKNQTELTLVVGDDQNREKVLDDLGMRMDKISETRKKLRKYS